MKTAIITDSNSGINEVTGRELGIFVIPMPVIIDGKIYYEGVNISQSAFYDSLTSGKNVSTSQPSPGDVICAWEDVFKKGYDEIVYIPMSSGLSSSCHSAIGLAEDYDGRVQVVDNHRISVTQRQSVLDAKKLADKGCSSTDIKVKLEESAYESSIYVAVDTLEFLKKGGRVTAAGAAIGTVLNIKPVLTIQGDKLDAFAKIRGMKKCEKKMLEAIKNDYETRFAGVEASSISIGAAGTFDNQKMADEWFNAVREYFPGAYVFYDPLTFSVGCHVGPNSAGIGICRIIE
ncbi:EDD domain protein, DegV family [Hathewaya proteolytica DSM 3090]|uniref:EDD domain protein, DegV family n=1 Tax=Hathewaya proteolytica DSM 3090 TaxID=1121331 RepID=A0A1M6K375_9CLOT|nr:DegV family protein [Hathewaya proteolytica]SHJ53357.1 EDD domain protein, DegV family [Hathewaya proteolytica DSM 3090]